MTVNREGQLIDILPILGRQNVYLCLWFPRARVAMIVGTITMATKHIPTKKSRMSRPFKNRVPSRSPRFDADSAEDSTLAA